MARPRAKAETSTEPIVRAGLRRLGIYDVTDSTVPIQWHGEPMGRSWANDLTIRAAIKRYNKRAAAKQGCTMAMAVFPYQREFWRE